MVMVLYTPLTMMTAKNTQWIVTIVIIKVKLISQKMSLRILMMQDNYND